MTDTRQKCSSCKGRGLDEWGGTCCMCGGQGREPFREHGKEDDEDNPHEYPVFECPDCSKDIADTETKHAAGCTMIDIVDRLRAEASYHFSSLFGEAADEIQILRKAKQDAFDLGFKAAGGSIHRIIPKSAPRSIGSLPSGESDPSVTLDFRGADT